MLQPYLYANKIEAGGIDEAGRGCYAGPVVAAAVILPAHFHHPLLNDSKKLKKEQRDLLRNKETCFGPLLKKKAFAGL